MIKSAIYNGPVPIKPARYNDLIKLCENHLRPSIKTSTLAFQYKDLLSEENDKLDYELQ